MGDGQTTLREGGGSGPSWISDQKCVPDVGTEVLRQVLCDEHLSLVDDLLGCTTVEALTPPSSCPLGAGRWTRIGPIGEKQTLGSVSKNGREFGDLEKGPLFKICLSSRLRGSL